MIRPDPSRVSTAVCTTGAQLPVAPQFRVAKLIEALVLLAPGCDSSDSHKGCIMTETATATCFVVVPRTAEHGGYENECFTHFVEDNAGRYCLRGPMVQSDAEWLANNVNRKWG